MPGGWYEDPWGQAAWRWYDGAQWTGHTSGIAAAATQIEQSGPAVTPQIVQPKKPFLPSFLSWPVVICALPSLAFFGWVLFTAPIAALLGFVPLVIVAPVLLWLDRSEPEPRSAKIHAFLWGAFVAGLISVIVNTTVGLTLGETAAAVASAPTIEEITKGLGIAWMVRRKEVDGPMDGIVYAGWVALGFAMIENVSYFQFAFEQDLLIQTFVVRALLTPFAHPLFSMWIGLAIGLAIRGRRSAWTGVWGLFVAMALHAAWNGSLTIGGTEGGAPFTIVVILLFIALFAAAAIGVNMLFARDQKRYGELVPFLASRYGMSHEQVHLLIDRKALRAARGRSASRAESAAMMNRAKAMNRLAALFDHDDNPNPLDEARLYSQLIER